MSDFIDIHNHLIPGIDDGPEEIQESIDALNLLKDIGFKKIILTPHIIQSKGLFWDDEKTLKNAFNKLKGVVENKISLELSAEYRFPSDIENIISNKKIFTILNSKFFLIDFWSEVNINIMKNLLFFSNRFKYKPIIAHPERSFSIDEIEFFKDIGYKLQINLGSLIGKYGKEVMRKAEYLFEKRIADFLATDTHSLNDVNEVKNFFKLCIKNDILNNRIKNLMSERILKLQI